MRLTLPRVGREMRPVLVRLVLGVVLIVGIVAGPGIYGRAIAGGRLSPSLQDVRGSANVRVELDFTPQAFNQEQLTSYGVFAGRRGNSVILMHVPADRLQDLANVYWVAKVEPFGLSR